MRPLSTARAYGAARARSTRSFEHGRCRDERQPWRAPTKPRRRIPSLSLRPKRARHGRRRQSASHDRCWWAKQHYRRSSIPSTSSSERLAAVSGAAHTPTATEQQKLHSEVPSSDLTGLSRYLVIPSCLLGEQAASRLSGWPDFASRRHCRPTPPMPIGSDANCSQNPSHSSGQYMRHSQVRFNSMDRLREKCST